jgi:hypothetical protein
VNFVGDFDAVPSIHLELRLDIDLADNLRPDGRPILGEKGGAERPTGVSEYAEVPLELIQSLAQTKAPKFTVRFEGTLWGVYIEPEIVGVTDLHSRKILPDTTAIVFTITDHEH